MPAVRFTPALTVVLLATGVVVTVLTTVPAVAGVSAAPIIIVVGPAALCSAQIALTSGIRVPIPPEA